MQKLHFKSRLLQPILLPFLQASIFPLLGNIPRLSQPGLYVLTSSGERRQKPWLASGTTLKSGFPSSQKFTVVYFHFYTIGKCFPRPQRNRSNCSVFFFLYLKKNGEGGREEMEFWQGTVHPFKKEGEKNLIVIVVETESKTNCT